ncbi:MAG: glycyl-tRNA synthetase [Parcubacteria group bacterium Gr01-1014_18]|nr:MAG: glycyl-tRNA synthetase [Parcubacteria group bacterium Greene0416_36]TSC80966.1 MAG: glycyl-tRNA synthetase [Parcubacteria group bacterium Gr01-1014_18]TSC98853.1 MAG: glycyl-tRNA synthetase [Parcubacteria group bacterium Greene1014_20]TSD06561.1 MAG: glycyl-tRNA synthetase [Parcubacteria group bacterium Greene0714_2]
MTDEFNKRLEEIVSLCKRRGFIYPSSEIYGGFSSTYDLGPLGALLAENIKNLWRKELVQKRPDVFLLDGAIFCHPKTWEASGHVASFNDPLVEDKLTHIRYRADHLIEEKLGISTSGMKFEEMARLIVEHKLKSPAGNEFTELESFNLMMTAKLGATESGKEEAYLRGETCQIIFLQYKNLVNYARRKMPFGVLQIGKAFRNEVTTKQFVLRTREFNQMEFEFFTRDAEALTWYDYWKEFFLVLLTGGLGIDGSKIRYRKIPKEEMSHYAKEQHDLEILLTGGKWLEISPLNHRGVWDLSRHSEYSGEDLSFFDSETKEKFVPTVLETSFGLERVIYVLLDQAYTEEEVTDSKGNKEKRIVLKFKPSVAPIKAAILPLMKKDGLAERAKEIYGTLSNFWSVEYDESGSIGKRYRRQDEIGTPFCITVDYDTLEKGTVTVRHRDTMTQETILAAELENYLRARI